MLDSDLYVVASRERSRTVALLLGWRSGCGSLGVICCSELIQQVVQFCVALLDVVDVPSLSLVVPQQGSQRVRR